MFDKTILYSAAQSLGTKARFNKRSSLESEVAQFISEALTKVDTPTSVSGKDEDSIGVTPSAKPTGTVERESKEKVDAVKAVTQLTSSPTESTEIFYSYGRFDIRDCLQSSKSIIANPLGNPDRFDNPAIAFYVHRGDSVCLPRRDAEVLSVFCNGIPTIELTRCVPYFEMTLISLSEKFKTQTVSISLAGFLEDKGKNGEASDFARVFPNNIPNNAKDPTKLNFYSGMELFTSPQTLFNPNGSRGLNKILPFMTLNSADINVISMGQGFYSYKQATLRMTLHDRTRMPEIAQLLAVDMFSQNHVVLEYGWSHPDGGPGSLNEFGKLLNNMRCKENYTVSKSNFNISTDGGGSVSIDLTLTMMPGDQARAISAASGDKVQTDLIKNALVSVLKSKSSENSTPDVQSKMVIKSKNLMSPTTLVPRSSYVQLVKQLLSDRFDDDKFKSDSEAILAEISTNTSDERTTTIAGILSSRYMEIIESAVFGDKSIIPFLNRMENNLAIAEVAFPDKGDYIPLGVLLYAFMAYPLGSSCRFDEVQVHTYNLNMNSLYGSDVNISEIPIPSNIVHSVIGEISNPTAYTIIRAIIDQTVNRQDFFFYGLNDLYEKKESITKESQAKGPDGQAAEISPEVRDSLQKSIERTENDIAVRIKNISQVMGSPTAEFIVPDVRIYVESLPMLESGQSPLDLSSRTVTRVHVYDKNRTPYFGEQVMIRSLTPGEIVSTYNKVESPKDSTGKGAVNQKRSNSDTSTISAAFSRAKMVEIIETNLPTIKFGNDFSTVIQASVAANTAGPLADALLVESLKNARDPQIAKGSKTSAQEVTVIPSTLNVSMIGMPLMNYGQQFFVNLDTGTTADNIYAVTGLSHKISPDGFTTSLSLNPTFQGTVSSFRTAIQGALDKIENQD